MSHSEATDSNVWEVVAEWDSLTQPLAPLNFQQQNSIFELANVCTNKKLAPNVSGTFYCFTLVRGHDDEFISLIDK